MGGPRGGDGAGVGRSALLLRLLAGRAFKKLVIRAAEVIEGAALAGLPFELDHARCESAYEVTVVAHEYDRALEIKQTVEQALDRFDVEVVRRFVKNQDVMLTEHHLRKQQTRGLATAQRRGILEGLVASEEKLAHCSSHGLLVEVREERIEPLVRGEAFACFADGLVVVLRKVANTRVVPPADPAAVRG